MIQQVIPDYYIRIGIKNGKVCHVDWAQMINHERIKWNLHDGGKQIKKVAKYLKEASKFVKG